MLASRPPVVIDADPWLRSCRLPYCTLARFRAMRVGDVYLLVDFDGPGIVPAVGGRGAVHLERERGAYVLGAVWTLHLGRNARRRGHLWVPAMRFRILSGRRLELLEDKGPGAPLDGLRLASVVLRRAALLSRWARASGEQSAGGSWDRPSTALSPQFFHRRAGTEIAAAAVWLERLRGPALTDGKEVA